MTNALFLGTAEDQSYVPHLKGMFNGLTTYVVLEPWAYLSQLEMYCAKRQVTKVVSTNTRILQALLAREGNTKDTPRLSDYAGSLFTYGNLEIVFVNPLDQLFSISYGKFLAERYISKVSNPAKWGEATEFRWSILSPEMVEACYTRALAAYAIAIDIETFKSPLSIRCIGYTFIYLDPNGAIRTESAVLPLDSEWALAWMRRFNALPAAKIFQNGKYDVSYLLRYNSAPTNWLWDTTHLFHCHYSELPKDLAFLNAFFLRKVVYWKDLAETTDLREYYRYNALDTWATANVWIQQMLQMPAWARKNYLLEFPLVYPCLLAEMTGLKRDPVRHVESRNQVDAEIAIELTSLRKMVGSSTFNTNSPPQVKDLLKILGCGDITSTKEIFLAKAMYRHPINNRILGKVLTIRGLRKLATTYLRLDSDAKQTGIHAGEGGAKEFQGFWLYTQNPQGTETGRLASGEHHFWCGANIQNAPTRDGPIVKQTVVAEEGFYIGECDLEQAETRDTAYISGDTALIANVSGVNDFHSLNVVAMTGKKYEDVYDNAKKKTKNKKLRDIFKRVNHGANYNMGPDVLVDTMGLEMIWEAKKLLGLPFNDPKQIADHLLAAFHRTYPKLRGAKAPYTEGTYYAWVAQCVLIDRRLTSRAFHHTIYNLANYKPDEYIAEGDWTRYCFGRPDKNKLDLNSYVAHCPQSLNSRTLNEAWKRVFYEIALPNPTTFRLHAQIHDSILFSYKEGHEYLAERVRECMEIPVSVRDVSGTTRTFTVPAALKLGTKDEATGVLRRAKYWSETE